MKKTKIEKMQRELLSWIYVIPSPNEPEMELIIIPKGIMENPYIKTRESKFFKLIERVMGPIVTHSSGKRVSVARDGKILFMMRLKRPGDNATRLIGPKEPLGIPEFITKGFGD